MALQLRDLGREAYALQGGYGAWKNAGYPLEPMSPPPAQPSP